MVNSMLRFAQSNPTTHIRSTWTAANKKAFDLKLQRLRTDVNLLLICTLIQFTPVTNHNPLIRQCECPLRESRCTTVLESSSVQHHH